jgi:ectoine hydroxylase-related dioxygenase (phytanoyl-CoA dioxygenase family)
MSSTGSTEVRESPAALEAEFRREGYVVLRGALRAPLLDDVRDGYLALLRAKQLRQEATPFQAADAVHDHRGVLADFNPIGGNHDLNRWNMHLPSVMPFLHDDIVANPRAVDLLHSLLGSDGVLSVIASDTPFPGSGFQSAHQDSRFLRISANVALVDFTTENGPLEVWPRTHLPDPGDPSSFTSEPFEIDAARMKQIVENTPPKPLLLGAGDMVIRDHRMIHRGSPNRSTAARPMLSLYYQRPPLTVPYRAVSDAVARVSLLARETIRAEGVERVGPKALEAANHVGRLVDSLAASDRDYRREIPRTLWRELSPAARGFLRFARVEGEGSPATRKHSSASRSLLLTAYLVTGVPWARIGAFRLGSLLRAARGSAVGEDAR